MSQRDNIHIDSELVSWGIISKWKVVKLKFLIKSIQTGSTPSTNDDDYYDGDINWFTPGDYTESMYLINSHKKITEKAILDKEVRVLPKDTVAIVGIGATLGKVAILSHESSFNQQVTGVITNDLILPEYLYYWLQINKDTLIKTANYTTLPIINNQFIKEFNCVLPDIPIQIQIVDYLNRKCDDISNIVESKENLIRLLEEKRQAIITEAVTKGLNPNVKMKDSGVEWIGETPGHWDVIKAKYIFNEKSVKGYPEKRLLSISKGKGVIPRDEMEFKVVMAFKDLQNFKLVQFEDFVIHLRSFQSGFEMSKIEGIVSPAYSIFSLKNVGVANYYKYVFYSKVFIDAVASTTQSLRDGKPIAYNDFGNMEIMVPSLREQYEIAKYIEENLKTIDDSIVNIRLSIQKLKEYRQSLIYEAVTGKIDVRDIELD